MSGRQLKYGIYLPLFGPLGDPAAIVDLARRAEAAGWDGFFTWDHINSDGAQPIADPWVTLGAIAQATDRLRLGPMVTPLPRRRPWVVARHTATLSRLSGGRLIVGCGLGTDEFGDLSQFGEPTDAATRSAQFDEAIHIIRAMWDGRPYHEDGRYYQVNVDQAEPVPYRIPVWIASSAGGPGAAARAARSDGIFPNPGDHQLSADELATTLAAVRRAGLPESRPFEVAVSGNASQAWPDEHDIDLGALAAAGMTWWMESLIHFDPLELSQEVVDAGPPRI